MGAPGLLTQLDWVVDAGRQWRPLHSLNNIPVGRDDPARLPPSPAGPPTGRPSGPLGRGRTNGTKRMPPISWAA